jgi:hypothetical protein
MRSPGHASCCGFEQERLSALLIVNIAQLISKVNTAPYIYYRELYYYCFRAVMRWYSYLRRLHVTLSAARLGAKEIVRTCSLECHEAVARSVAGRG